MYVKPSSACEAACAVAPNIVHLEHVVRKGNSCFKVFYELCRTDESPPLLPFMTSVPSVSVNVLICRAPFHVTASAGATPPFEGAARCSARP